MSKADEAMSDTPHSFVVRVGVKLPSSDTTALQAALTQALYEVVHGTIEIIPVSTPAPVQPKMDMGWMFTRPMPPKGTYSKGSGGKLTMPGHQLDGMLVDFKRLERDGSLWVVLSDTRGPYREGAEFHVSSTQYEQMWEGTV